MFFLLVFSGGSNASNERAQSSSVKAETIKAVRAFSAGRYEQGSRIVSAARDPLAQKLYSWFMLTRGRNRDDYVHLVQFIRSNPDWPGVSALIRDAERNMPSGLRDQEVVMWFEDYAPQSGKGIDRYVQSLKNTGQDKKARQILSDWWASNTMSRDEQRELFRKYKGDLSVQAHKRRFDTMLLRGQYNNALAIAGVLGNGYPALAKARMALAEGQDNVNGLIAAVPSHLQGDAGLMYQRLKWRRKKNLDSGAAQILYKMPSSEKIQNLPDWWQERHIIIRRLIERRDWKSAYSLASSHQQKEGLPFAQGEWLAGWLALRFLNEPIKAYQHFDRLYRGVQTPISKARAAYWAGRASVDFKDKTISQRWYNIAAQTQTTYYGQLAGAELRLADALPRVAPPRLTTDEKRAFDRNELMQVANIFVKAGMRKDAGRFLDAFVAEQDTAQAYFYAAQRAIDLGLTHNAVRIAKRATRKGMFLTAQSYPILPYSLSRQGPEWSLVHGLIRQESMFDVDAQSPVGALGLMQLMPATAREVAGKMGRGYSKASLTTQPQYNIALGSYYLSGLLERYDNSYPLAIAAYNAGPGRVDRWVREFGDPRRGEVNLIDWIEMIPIYETRNYVQRVMEATYIYRLRLRSAQGISTIPLHIAYNDK